MDAAELVELIDRLRALPAETEWFEFKANRFEAQETGEYLSALANSASLANEPRGYLIFGIDDKSHEVTGTTFDPYVEKAKNNQGLIHWLSTGLEPRGRLEVEIFQHPKGRVVVLAVEPAKGQPVAFYGKTSIRVGSSKTALSRYPAKARAIWMRGYDWSAETCSEATLADLDPEALDKAREQFAVKHPRQRDEVLTWGIETLLNKSKALKRGSVTNAALILLGRAEAATLLSPAIAKLSWVLKDADNRELDYEHFGPPFLLASDRLHKKIRNLVIRTLPSGSLFPQEVTQYDLWVIREALHNCIAHQDYGLHGRITVVEFPDRIILSNVGDFLPGTVEKVIRQDAPQAIYRNPFLADAMVELNMIDTQGGGIKRMFETQRKRSFPLPDYDLSEEHEVTVTINGRILDERYTRLLMERTELSLDQVMLLDRVQRKRRITREEHRRLKAQGLVEGRYPNLIVAGEIARATGETARHIRERGFEKKYYLDLILALVREHGPVARKDVDEVLLSKLPDRLSPQQKKRKVHNLLQELRRSGLIANLGSRSRPQWISSEREDA